MLAARSEIPLLLSHTVLFGVSFYMNAEDILPPFSDSEHTASPHWLWGGCGSRSCWRIPAFLLTGLPSATSLLKRQSTIPLTSHHPVCWCVPGEMVGVGGSLLPPGHMHQRESFLNGACVHSHANTVISVICMHLLTQGKHAKILGKPWILGLWTVLFIFLVVQMCSNAVVWLAVKIYAVSKFEEVANFCN